MGKISRIHPKKPKIDTRWVDLFAKARENLPKTPLDWKIKAFVKEDNFVIQAIPPSGSKTELRNVTFFPEQRGLIEFSEFLKSEKAEEGYMIEIQRSRSATELPARLKGVLLSRHGGGKSKKTIAFESFSETRKTCQNFSVTHSKQKTE